MKRSRNPTEAGQRPYLVARAISVGDVFLVGKGQREGKMALQQGFGGRDTVLKAVFAGQDVS